MLSRWHLVEVQCRAKIVYFARQSSVRRYLLVTVGSRTLALSVVTFDQLGRVTVRKAQEATSSKTNATTKFDLFVAKIQVPTTERKSHGRKGNGRRRPAGGRSHLVTSVKNKNLFSQMVISRMPLFPPRTTRLLRYSMSSTLASAAGVVATYVFRANDCYDPDLTGTGHQPMGFDELMKFYDHFCVLKARLVVDFRTSTGTQGTVCIRQDGAASPLTVIDRILEFGGLVSDALGSDGGLGSRANLELGLDVARLHGLTHKTLLADPTLRGDVATSPTELTYFHVVIWNAAGVSFTVNFNVVLEQLVVFTEPRDMTQS